MDWATQYHQWPHHTHSRFVKSGGINWHAQQMGQGPDLLLIHGAGGATQSWRHLMPLLAKQFRCTAMDLPGQGFTPLPTSNRAGLDTMANGVERLASDLNLHPAGIIAHSAGVPIALRMIETRRGGPPIIGINAALSKFEGVAGWVFPLTAKVMANIPFGSRLFAAGGGRRPNVMRLLGGTGSHISDDMIALYTLLASDPDHVAGTLRMMADWSLDGLLTRLPKNPATAHFLVGGKDGTVPPKVSERACQRLPSATIHRFPELGHLAHEEAPDKIAGAIFDILG